MEQTQEDILRNNVKELQRQLQESYIRIKELKEELDKYTFNEDEKSKGHAGWGS